MKRMVLSVMAAALSLSCNADRQFMEKATIVSNGPYDFGYGEPSSVQALVVRIDRCPSALSAFRLESISHAGVGAIKPTPEQLECVKKLKPGDHVDVDVFTTRRRFGSESSKGWMMTRVGPCSLKNVDWQGTHDSTVVWRDCGWQ